MIVVRFFRLRSAAIAVASVDLPSPGFPAMTVSVPAGIRRRHTILIATGTTSEAGTVLTLRVPEMSGHRCTVLGRRRWIGHRP
jgi:hypothetical protein